MDMFTQEEERMEHFTNHFMQISVMNCAAAREQHVFVYNIWFQRNHEGAG